MLDFGNKVVTLEQNLNSLGQYGRRNNLVLSGTPEIIPDNQLENTVSSILSDIGVSMQSEEIEAYHLFGKTDRKTKSKKTIIRFVNIKHCKKPLLNKKKLSNINNGKFNFNAETKVFINEEVALFIYIILEKGLRSLQTAHHCLIVYNPNISADELDKDLKKYQIGHINGE